MIELRPYQSESVDELSMAFKHHKRVIFVLPTGGGKTVVFSEIAYRAIQKGTIVLILTDRIELFSQAVGSISKRDIPICKINANTKSIYEDALLFIGMVQTVARRLKKLNINPGLIIVDEAHKGNFFNIMDHWPNARVIGATATPINKKLHRYYSKIVHVIDIPELIAQNWLAPCRAYQMQDDFSDLEMDKSGEFTDQSLMAHFNKSKLYDGLIDKWLEKCKGKKTVVFNVNIEHAEMTTMAFNKAGIKSYCITSNTSPSERKWILEEFQKNSFPVLNNCGILTTGWDEPSLEVVALNRATTSLTLFLQMCGRGSRLFPGKSHFTILDFGKNHDRHGLWNEARQWNLNPPKKKKKASGVAPIRECPSCGALLPAQQLSCEFCNHTINKKDKPLLQGELIEIVPKHLVGTKISESTIDDLIHMDNKKAYKATYIWRIVRSRGEGAIREFAEKKGFKIGWIYNQTKKMKEEQEDGGTKFTNYTIKQKTQTI